MKHTFVRMFKHMLTPVAVSAMLAGAAWAAPTAEEVVQLGKTLTPVGALRAGNAEGTIPAWGGGLCSAPAGYKPRNGVGGYPYVDPYAAEKPLYTITAKNMDKYADKLDEGAKLLLQRYPTYRIDVYPTHRSACMPDWVYENTLKKVMSPKTTAGGVGLTGAHAQVPFPIPKTGYEVMWNAQLRYAHPTISGDTYSYLVDASGTRTEISLQRTDQWRPYWDKSREPLTTNDSFWAIKAFNMAPPAQKGLGNLLFVYLQPDVYDNMSYTYVPGQRRVRLAPEFKYDTVATNSGGILLYDEINGFYGAMDRFDFKLLGRREMLIQYNAWRTEQATAAQLGTPNHPNPDFQRWELHRVWVVQADLKPGQRHVQKQKIFLVDEDSWNVAAYYGFDQGGKPYHYIQLPIWQEYEKPSPYSGNYLLFDFSRGIWSSGSQQGNPEKNQTGFYKVESFPPAHFAPEALAGSGVR
jgi:hypothetical protein